MESIFTTGSSTVTPIPSPKSTMTPSIMTTSTTASQPPIPPTLIPSDIFPTLPTFASVFCFEDRVKSLEVNFSNILSIVHQYKHQQMPEAVREAVQIQTNRLQDSIQRENDEFLRTIDDNMKKIIKEQVKSQVNAQVIRILPRIEESVNTQLEAEVLTRSSHFLRTSYAVAADLSEMELKKILIDKMKGNKSIQRSDEQRNLYKDLVEAYDANKTILDTYRESAILKRRHEDDDQEGPFAGLDWGSKRQREGGEHASASTPSEPATRSAGSSTTGTQSRQLSASKSAFAEEPVHTTCQMEEPSHPPRKPPTPDRDWNKSLPTAQENAQSWISALANQTDACSSFNELLDTPIDFSNFIMNRLGLDTLTPELLAGLTYELMRGSCNSLTELEYHLEEVNNATTDQLDWDNPEGQQYPHNLLQPLPLIPNNQGRRVIPFKNFINNDLEYLRGGGLSRKYTTSVTKRKAADYGHIKWIEDLVPRGFKRLRLQDIEDMLLLLVQGKLSNLTVEEYFAFNVSLRMFTRSIIIQRHVEDLQLGVKSYQKRLNLTKPDTDGTLNDVRNALDDRLKEIRMKYLPTTIWRKGDKDKTDAQDKEDYEKLGKGTLKGKWRYLIPAKPPIHNHRNLYKALVEAYESNKIILDIYGDTDMLKRRRDDDADKDEEPSVGSNQGSNKRREGKEPELASTPKEKATRSTRKSTQGSKSRQTSTSESAIAEEPMQTTFKMEEPSHPEFETGADDQPIIEPSQHPEWFSQQKKPPTPDRHHVIPFDHFLNNDLEYLRGGASSHKYTTYVTKIEASDYGHIKWIKDLVLRTMWIQELVGYDKHALWGISHWGHKRQEFYGFAVNRESARDVYSKRRIIAITKLKIVEWHNYKHMKADKSDSRRTLCFQRLSLNVYKKNCNPKACGRPLTQCQKLPEEAQLTNPNTYRSDLKRKEAYIAYSNPRGFIYQNKDKQNRLMRIDELHKFNDGMLTDVRTALDDRLKGIRMKYLP
nr:hypothetical protein [Tanacetum cinerariifolium]